MRHWAVLSVVFALSVAPDSAVSQFSPGARSVGMGGAGMVFSSGVDAIEWNPANLGLGGGWSASAEVGASGLITGVSCDDLGKIFGFGSCSSTPWGWNFDDAQCTPGSASGLPASGVAVGTRSEGFLTALGAEQANLPRPGSPLPTVGLSVGSFGLRVRSHVATESTVSKELLELMCDGFDPARMQDYRVGDTGFRSTSLSEVTAVYGLTLGARLGIGIGLRYVMGHSLMQANFFEPVVDLGDQSIEVNGVGVESSGGSGFGLDLGLALQLTDELRLSASGTNIVQRMKWDDGLVAHTATFVGCATTSPTCPGDDFSELSLEDFFNRFEEQPINDGSVSLPVYETSRELFRAAYFPTIFRAGAGFRTGGTAVELVGTTVSPKGRQRSDWDERLSLGVDQALWILQLRAGGALGSDGLQVIGGGLGLRFGAVHLDLGGGVMSGGFDFASAVVSSEKLDYSGSYATVSLQVVGGGR